MPVPTLAEWVPIIVSADTNSINCHSGIQEVASIARGLAQCQEAGRRGDGERREQGFPSGRTRGGGGSAMSNTKQTQYCRPHRPQKSPRTEP